MFTVFDKGSYYTANMEAAADENLDQSFRYRFADDAESSCLINIYNQTAISAIIPLEVDSLEPVLRNLYSCSFES